MRRRLSWIAAAWLACRLVTIGVVCAPSCVEVTSAAEAVCTCTHADDGQCPMHRHAPAPQQSPCSCRSTGDAPGAAVLALLAPAMVAAPAVAAPIDAVAAIDVQRSPRPRGRVSTPEPPPPKPQLA